jgi:hypothetical protein
MQQFSVPNNEEKRKNFSVKNTIPGARTPGIGKIKRCSIPACRKGIPWL